MGININTLKALSLLSEQQDFRGKSVITLGRQNVCFSEHQLRRLFYEKKLLTLNQCAKIASSIFADSLFLELGFSIVHSMDYSDFEGAQLLHDLNLPIDNSYKNRYDLVIDGGTLEHVFNFPEAINSCMKIVKKGGHLIIATPANNLLGHGFYQFSPELFYRIFSNENGFKIFSIFVNGKISGTWYSVADPQQVGERVVLRNNFTTEMIIISAKISDEAGLNVLPQQSDYKTQWDKFAEQNEGYSQGSRLREYYRKFIPEYLRDKIWTLRHRKKTYNLGFYYKGHFKKMT